MMSQAIYGLVVIVLMAYAALGAETADAPLPCSSGVASSCGDESLALLQVGAQRMRVDRSESTCTIYGDPHVITFDRAPVKPVISLLDISSPVRSDNGAGDFWLVKSNQVQIQGRFSKVPTSGRLFLRGLAVSGPFLKDNILLISGHSLDGKVFWNREQILKSAPSEYSNSLISAKYHRRTLVQDPTRTAVAPGFDIDLPLGVRLAVNRGRNGLGIKISMPPMEGGQDGQCGNFNGDGRDDTPKLISERMGLEVLFPQLLFRHPFIQSYPKKVDAPH